jgi:hypothetical protein
MNENRQKHWPAVVLIICLGIVGAWEVASKLAARKWEKFDLTRSDFQDFTPQSERWHFREKPLGENPDPRAPNILAYLMEEKHLYRGNREIGRDVLVRCVHGYNMPDCMRIKHYKVRQIGDTGAAEIEGREVDLSQVSGSSVNGRIQVWLLESQRGEVSVWATKMVRTATMAGTEVDVCSMAFPRIGIPDSPDWAPEGITLESLKNPIKNLKKVLRAKWNASRSDILTFLKLKQPAWASKKMLTLVGISQGRSVGSGEVEKVSKRVVKALNIFHRELKEYGKTASGGSPADGGSPPAGGGR